MTQDERWAIRYEGVSGCVRGFSPLSRNDRSAALDNTSNYKIILAKHV